MRISLIRSIILTLSVNICNQAIPQKSVENITRMLASRGFENIRMIESGDTLKIAYENNVYRWDVRGMVVALDSIANQVRPEMQIRLVTIRDNVPVFEARVMASDWLDFRDGSMTKKEFDEKIQLTYSTGEVWKSLMEVKRSNPDQFKFDFIIYPQVYIQNNYFDYIYEVQFNIAPAVLFSLWKGGTLTGQVIIPIYNNPHLDPEGNYVRPGFITLSQRFRLPGPVFSKITIGKFDGNRYGIDLNMTYPFRNPHFAAGLQAGYTSWTYFSDGTLTLGREFLPTFNVNASYYYSRFDLQFDIGFGRYLWGDFGTRIDCTRHFGETAVGVWAMYSGSEPNGGFHVAIPFPPGNRGKTRHVRILPPRYFDWEYRARHIIPTGMYYKSTPDENRSGDYFNLMYIKNSLN